MNKLWDKNCPDEIYINNYIHNQCSRVERYNMETHLIKCSKCRILVVMLVKCQSDMRRNDK